MIYLILYLFLSLLAALFSLGKRISFFEIFFISIILTPIIGFITVFRANGNIVTHHYTMMNTCTSCGDDSPEKEKVCQHCGTEIAKTVRQEYKLKLA